MKKLSVPIVLASMCVLFPASLLASSVNCVTVGDRAVCTFSFGDDNVSKENDILYFQCVVSPKVDFKEKLSDIKVDMFNTNVRTAGFQKGGTLNGVSGTSINNYAFANKWARDTMPHTVSLKIVKGHAELMCKSANQPTRSVYGFPSIDSNYQ